MMRAARLVVTFAIAFASNGPASGFAQFLPPKPTPTPVPRELCLAQIGSVAALPQPDEFALTFDTLDRRRVSISGMVSLYAGERTYAVKVHGVAAGPAKTANDRVPLVVRMPAGLGVDAAVLTSIDAAPGAACIPFAAHALVANAKIPVDDAFLKRAAAAAPIDVSAPVQTPAQDCSSPNRAAKTDQVASLEPTPELHALGGNVEVIVDVLLDDTGKPLDATVMHSSSNAAVDRSVVAAALRSTYTPELFRCRPVGSHYLFVGDFAPK